MEANLAALRVLRDLQTRGAQAAPEEQAVLARWSSWGALADVFDPGRRPEWGAARLELRSLLDETAWSAAARTTVNAHYTDAGYVAAIWRAAGALGYSGGSVLEPGCGSGNFLGLAPPGSQLIGVEQDSTTAAIARQLYPEATVLAESFADTLLPEGSVDLVVGNVPFGDFVLHDPLGNPSRHRIHNHFILKATHALRPGGMALLLTSQWTLDAGNEKARAEIGDLADLIGVVRLPSGAHRRAAGTEAVTDLLLLRRRAPGEAPRGLPWQSTVRRRLPRQDKSAAEMVLNEAIAGREEDPRAVVLGELTVGHGMYGADDLLVRGGADVAAQLERALTGIVERAESQGLGWRARQAGEGAALSRPLERERARPEGFITASSEGAFVRVESGREVPFEVPRSQRAELGQLLRMRDLVMELLQEEARRDADEDRLSALRAALNESYDRYLERYGPLNRFSWARTGRVDEEGQEILRRQWPRKGGIDLDTYGWAVLALERFDPESQGAEKASILRGRVVAPRSHPERAASAADALAIAIDEVGAVDLTRVAQLLELPGPGEARAALGDLVFADPGQAGRLEPAAAYLSGDVRAKLAAAEQAERESPGAWAANLTALQAVLPRQLGPQEIRARLGATWIPPQVVQQFLGELLDAPHSVVVEREGTLWSVRAPEWPVPATTTWGTSRVPAGRLVQALLEQRTIKVRLPEVDGGGLDLQETTAAQEKAREIQERFASWIWEDEGRARTLVERYNRVFNSVVLRSYDQAQMALPGLTANFEPHPHQVAAVARIVAEPCVLLAHEVGSGKTAEMVMGAAELRRLGLVRKPAFVVPNHLVEQFSREFLQLYPQARILVGDETSAGAGRRREFLARAATGDWDGVIMSRSAFERLPVSRRTQQEYMVQEVDLLRRQAAQAQANGSMTVKRLERVLLRAQERLERNLASARDEGVSFEQSGIDYLFIDEAHGYKNLRTVTNLEGCSIIGSQRADDLLMKLTYLRQGRGRRVATFVTATPISNAVSEAFTMQRYLQPEVLERADVAEFDAWAAQFGETRTEIELAPAGDRYRQQTRFAKYANVPELLTMLHQVADVKLSEDLALPRPAVRGGKPEIVVVPSSEALERFVAELGRRAELVGRGGGIAQRGQDNMLAISTDGRLGALDLRLVRRHDDPGAPSKIEVAADRIQVIWEELRTQRFPSEEGAGWSSRPGALQLVFADVGTPRPGAWNVYEELRDQLLARSLPRERVRFIHEARNDREKGELFAACRSGQVSVLIGSTEKMGTGTNVQLRALALHHLDCPWRPADVEQREGRILRQGNANPEVRVFRYVREGSFDAYVWQTVERKARFTSQVMRGRLDVREIEDTSVSTLSYAEVKALAAGDERLMELAHLEGEVGRLERLERAWSSAQFRVRAEIERSTLRLGDLGRQVPLLERALEQRQETRGDAFCMTTPEGRTVTDRTTAGTILAGALERGWEDLQGGGGRPEVDLGRIAGFAARASVERVGLERRAVLRLHLAGGAGEIVPDGHARISSEVPPIGLVTRLEHRVQSLDEARERHLREISDTERSLLDLHAELGRPFGQGAALEQARSSLTQLRAAIEESADRGGRGERPTAVAPAARDRGALLRSRATNAGALGSTGPAPVPERGQARGR